MSKECRLTQALSLNPIVAIVRLDDLSKAVELTEALLAGGIRAVEFTLTNKSAVDTIAKVRDAIKDDGCLIGAGSVLTIDDADRCIDKGAQFIVTPILDTAVVGHIKKRQCLATPGAFTPTEIYTAWQAGADMVKVFPARCGGPDFIKDVLAPLPFLKLIPTGGVSLNNAHAFMRAGAAALGIGSQLVDPQMVSANDFDALRARAQEFVQAARESSAA